MAKAGRPKGSKNKGKTAKEKREETQQAFQNKLKSVTAKGSVEMATFLAMTYMFKHTAVNWFSDIIGMLVSPGELGEKTRDAAKQGATLGLFGLTGLAINAVGGVDTLVSFITNPVGTMFGKDDATTNTTAARIAATDPANLNPEALIAKELKPLRQAEAFLVTGIAQLEEMIRRLETGTAGGQSVIIEGIQAGITGAEGVAPTQDELNEAERLRGTLATEQEKLTIVQDAIAIKEGKLRHPGSAENNIMWENLQTELELLEWTIAMAGAGGLILLLKETSTSEIAGVVSNLVPFT